MSRMVLSGGLQALLLAFPALFSIVNPLAGAIIFSEVTSEQTHAERFILARDVALYSTMTMLVALWGGSYILSFFGITLNALRIAGGIVVSVRAYEMLATPGATVQRKEQQAAGLDHTGGSLSGYAFFPLTMPFTTGPGTIAVAVSLGTERPDGWLNTLVFFTGASLAVLGMALIIWVLYATADHVTDALGNVGRQVVSRIAAFLLLGIGVQITLSGAVPVLHAALSP